ncbi:hypothetical protein [Micromonospora sp. CPCC 206061]|uniref:hypothetical protein n=1 Tax=Micromonospora sp. CPCC 206061 TaxID=3122410 RepID=UPI002FF11C5C
MNAAASTDPARLTSACSPYTRLLLAQHHRPHELGRQRARVFELTAASGTCRWCPTARCADRQHRRLGKNRIDQSESERTALVDYISGARVRARADPGTPARGHRGGQAALLQDRERVTAAAELDEWARVEAPPSDEEISRLRKLIRRVETDLDDLTGEEQQQIRDAVAMLRKTRSVQLGTPGGGPAGVNLRLERDA